MNSKAKANYFSITTGFTARAFGDNIKVWVESCPYAQTGEWVSITILPPY